jgi:hypothetical protein
MTRTGRLRLDRRPRARTGRSRLEHRHGWLDAVWQSAGMARRDRFLVKEKAEMSSAYTRFLFTSRSLCSLIPRNFRRVFWLLSLLL